MTKSKDTSKDKKKPKPKAKPKAKPRKYTKTAGFKEVTYNPPVVKVSEKIQRMADRLINGFEVKYDPMIHIPILLRVFAEGGNVCTFCTEAEVCRTTYYTWRDIHPEFGRSILVAKELAHQEWLSKAPDNLNEDIGGKFNTKLWWGIMKSRFGYTDNRMLDLPNLQKCNTPQEQVECLIDYIAKGTLTAQEGQVLSSLVQTALKVEENTELKAKLEELEEVVGALNGTK